MSDYWANSIFMILFLSEWYWILKVLYYETQFTVDTIFSGNNVVINEKKKKKKMI